MTHHIKLASIHDFKYDYSKVDVNATGEIEILCPEHGVFTTTILKHRNGAGCTKCEELKERTLLDEEFKVLVQQFNDKYDFKYRYTNSVYKSMGRKIEILCPEHGVFHQTPKQHLESSNCKGCNAKRKVTPEKEAELRATETQKKLLVEAFREVYGEKYNYDLFFFRGLKKKFVAQCSSHGAFKTTPLEHIRGEYCPDCRAEHLK